MLEAEAAITAAAGGAVVVATGVAGARTAVGAAVLGADATAPDATGALATDVGAAAGWATTAVATGAAVVGTNALGRTVTERIVPASTLLDGADTRSPLTVPPLVRARRGKSMEAASISAGPLTLTVPVLPSDPFGTSAFSPPEIVALPRSTFPKSEPTVKPLDTVTFENFRSPAACTSALLAESDIGCPNVFDCPSSTAPLGAERTDACVTLSGPD